MARRVPLFAAGLRSTDAATDAILELAFAYRLFDKAREHACRAAFTRACPAPAATAARNQLAADANKANRQLDKHPQRGRNGRNRT